MIGGGPTGSVGGTPALAQWAVPAEHLCTRGKLQVIGKGGFLLRRDTHTAASGAARRRATMLTKSQGRQLTLNIKDWSKEVGHGGDLAVGQMDQS